MGTSIGDGHCDKTTEYNSPSCFFDGGDCCPDTCQDSTYFSCAPDKSEEGYLCLDPQSAEYLCDGLIDASNEVGENLCETCADFMGSSDRSRIRDGRCDADLNIEGCLWDGGTCDWCVTQ